MRNVTMNELNTVSGGFNCCRSIGEDVGLILFCADLALMTVKDPVVFAVTLTKLAIIDLIMVPAIADGCSKLLGYDPVKKAV